MAPALTFLVALAGFALAALTRTLWSRHRRHRSARRDRRYSCSRSALVLLPFVLGVVGRTVEPDPAAAPHTTIAVIQGNVPEPGLEFNAKRRAVTDMHAAETHKLAEAVRAGTAPTPQLVIWPENASDIDPYRNPDDAEEISAAARDIGVPILVGAVVGTDDPRRNYNRAIVWDPVTGPGQYYDKRHPVPFGEYMPYALVLPDLLRQGRSAAERVPARAPCRATWRWPGCRSATSSASRWSTTTW